MSSPKLKPFNKKEENAKTQYEGLRKEIDSYLATIKSKVSLHTSKGDEINWGHVGDLSSIKTSLNEILISIANYGE